MATGRTISANFLTDLDTNVINLCEKISNIFLDALVDTEKKKEFKKTYGKISKNRDAGAGRGGGKLQRDALCTRGIQGKAPFSNRNLRWHPLVTAEQEIPFAKTIEKIVIEGEDDAQTLNFVIKDKSGSEYCFPSDKAHELPERYVVLPEHWIPHIDRLKYWNDNLWTQNSCIITAYESCDWWDAIETYAVLGISVIVDFFDVNFESIFYKIKNLLENQELSQHITLPSNKFPTDKADIISCPLCKVKKSSNPAKLPDRKREIRWKPTWSGNKRGEGDDSSMQIMHVNPLNETNILHNASNVRYGHRWCNVAMTDHSVEETVDFMEYITRVHGRI